MSIESLQKAVQILGGQAAMARAISTPARKIKQPHIYKWLNSQNHDRMPPAEYCPAIERATAGMVRCEELRADVDWSVLRKSDCEELRDSPSDSGSEEAAA